MCVRVLSNMSRLTRHRMLDSDCPRKHYVSFSDKKCEDKSERKWCLFTHQPIWILNPDASHRALPLLQLKICRTSESDPKTGLGLPPENIIRMSVKPGSKQGTPNQWGREVMQRFIEQLDPGCTWVPCAAKTCGTLREETQYCKTTANKSSGELADATCIHAYERDTLHSLRPSSSSTS